MSLVKEGVRRFWGLIIIILFLVLSFVLYRNVRALSTISENENNNLREESTSESNDYEQASVELKSFYVVSVSEEESEEIRNSIDSEDEEIEEEPIVEDETTEDSEEEIKEEKTYKKIYTTTSVNIRKKPSTRSKVVKVVGFNTKLKGCKYDDDWYEVKMKNHIYYVSADYVSNKKAKYREVTIPNYSGFKSWMPYTAITNRSSKQYKLQQMASTGTYGIRCVNGRYCIAVGTGVNAGVGQYVDLVLKNGTVISCIVGDLKANCHTQSNNLITIHSDCCSEFIISSSALNHNARRDGDMSSACDSWDSRVVKIRVFEKNELD